MEGLSMSHATSHDLFSSAQCISVQQQKKTDQKSWTKNKDLVFTYKRRRGVFPLSHTPLWFYGYVRELECQILLICLHCAPLPEKGNHLLHQFRRKSSWKIHVVLSLLGIPQFRELLYLCLPCLISFSPTHAM